MVMELLISLVPAVQELWNTWEIHSLIIVSLLLQFFLFLFAGMRRYKSSWVLSTFLWLAYLSADSVGIFVLGHLAVHASEPGHQLISLWAPFVLVHLGGQDTITALSRQDNELWLRHLLSFVSQVLVAAYAVAAVAPWPAADGRLTAAMVLVFLCGFIKYAERTYCLYQASPGKLRSDALRMFSWLTHTQSEYAEDDDGMGRAAYMKRQLLEISQRGSTGLRLRVIDHTLEWGSSGLELFRQSSGHIISTDVPLNIMYYIPFAENHLPGILDWFRTNAGRCKVYEYVGVVLVDFYQELYTKTPLRRRFSFTDVWSFLREYVCAGGVGLSSRIVCCGLWFVGLGPSLLYNIIRYFSIPIALVLFCFWAVEKAAGDQSGRGDVAVSYILFAGALVLDVTSATISIFSHYKILQLLPAAWRNNNKKKKQWSEELAQYSIIKRHVVQDTTTVMASIQQWVGRRLGAWGVGLLDLTHTPITQDHTPIKEFILDKLLDFGRKKKWDFASSRGRLALDEWQEKHKNDDGGDRPGRHRLFWRSSKRPNKKKKAQLEKTILSSGIDDFPMSVLIWHIATGICYNYNSGDPTSTGGGGSDHGQMKKHKQMSRELSNYIMYLVFKCRVMLTANSQHVHEKAHDEISKALSRQHQVISEKDAVNKLFEASKVHEEGLQDHSTVEIQDQKHKSVTSSTSDNAARNHIKRLQKGAKALDSSVLLAACEVANELISLTDESERWDLIASVWSEMLFYTAPRCGGDFHYEHLSTGGEFITHVLLLMMFLGPFLPPPTGASTA